MSKGQQEFKVKKKNNKTCSPSQQVIKKKENKSNKTCSPSPLSVQQNSVYPTAKKKKI